MKTGYAIVFSEDMEKPVHVYIERDTNTNEPDVPDELIKNHFESNQNCFGETYKNMEILKNFNLFKKIGKCISNRKMDIKLHENFVKNLHELEKTRGFSKQYICESLCNWFNRVENRKYSGQELEEMINLLKNLIDENITSYDSLDMKSAGLFIQK